MLIGNVAASQRTQTCVTTFSILEQRPLTSYTHTPPTPNTQRKQAKVSAGDRKVRKKSSCKEFLDFCIVFLFFVVVVVVAIELAGEQGTHIPVTQETTLFDLEVDSNVLRLSNLITG